MSRRATQTSAFGVSRRESHDASRFYRRFTPPAESADESVATWRSIDKLIVGDGRDMKEVPDASVALVVTSPPYFAGKEYELAVGEGGVPSSYLDYLEMLRAVFAECARTLEPGGRIAVNVANLGRRPYRSLAADVIRILQDDLRLLLRGEVVWLKQRGSSGSCAWGSFQSAANPVLRDTTERVVIASKGRFDRALTPARRAAAGLPHESSMTRDDFMENTLDLWEIPPESASRIGHPAPFPVELVARLIDLYTYRGDLVLDPFIGSGTTALAARASGRHYVGYDLDESYIQLAEDRLHLAAQHDDQIETALPILGGRPVEADGSSGKQIGRALIEAAGFTDLHADVPAGPGVSVAFSAREAAGPMWLFDVVGGITTHRAGLRKPELFWKALGKAAVVHEATSLPLVLMSAQLPDHRSSAGRALQSVTGPGRMVRQVIHLGHAGAVEELQALTGSPPGGRAG